MFIVIVAGVCRRVGWRLTTAEVGDSTRGIAMRHNKNLFRGFVGAVGLSLASWGSHAQTTCPNSPSFNDLILPTGVQLLNTCGYYSGNVLSGNASDTALIQSVLSILAPDLTYTSGGWMEKIDDNGGSTTVDFNYALKGLTVVTGRPKDR